MYYNPSDLASALEKNEKMRAAAAGVVWNPEKPSANSALYLNEERSYERTAANQRADLQVGAVAPDTSGRPVTFVQALGKILTTPFSDNSPYAPF